MSEKERLLKLLRQLAEASRRRAEQESRDYAEGLAEGAAQAYEHVVELLEDRL